MEMAKDPMHDQIKLDKMRAKRDKKERLLRDKQKLNEQIEWTYEKLQQDDLEELKKENYEDVIKSKKE